MNKIAFNYENALERVDGDKEFLFGLIEEFFTYVNDELNNLKAAAREYDLPKFKSIIHTLKGTLGNLGAHDAFHFIAKTEHTLTGKQILHLENITNDIITMIEDFRAGYHATKQEHLTTLTPSYT